MTDKEELIDHIEQIIADNHDIDVTDRDYAVKVADWVAAKLAVLEAELADANNSVIAFGAPHMARYAEERGMPEGHLFATHYDILEKAGARMVSFKRGRP